MFASGELHYGKNVIKAVRSKRAAFFIIRNASQKTRAQRQQIREMQRVWSSLEREIKSEKLESITILLKIQEEDAVAW